MLVKVGLAIVAVLMQTAIAAKSVTPWREKNGWCDEAKTELIERLEMCYDDD